MVLHKLERATNRKSCDRDAGGCGRKSTLQVFLQGPQPRCFALQLVWESGQESGLDIRETLDIIQEVRGCQMLVENCLKAKAASISPAGRPIYWS